MPELRAIDTQNAQNSFSFETIEQYNSMSCFLSTLSEIHYSDGSDSKLFYTLKYSSGSKSWLSDFFIMEEEEDLTITKCLYLIDKGFDYDDVQELITKAGGVEYIEDCYIEDWMIKSLGEIPSHLTNYIDLELYQYDLEVRGDIVEIDGGWVVNCHSIF